MKHEEVSKVESIFISFAVIGLAGLFYTLAMILSFEVFGNDMFMGNIVFLLPFNLVGFIILPYFVSAKLCAVGYREINLHYVRLLLLLFPTFFILFFVFKVSLLFLIHNFIIAISEEFLCRFVIFKILRTKFNLVFSILIASLLFGVVLHLESGWINNIFVKVPAAVILELFYLKWGLDLPIFFHWLNNSLVDMLI